MRTPGESLLTEYLKPMGISQNAMARAIGVAPRAVNEIVLGKRSITPQMSIRFGTFFGQPHDYWIGLQIEQDFRALGDHVDQIRRSVQPAAALAPKRVEPKPKDDSSEPAFLDVPTRLL